LQPNLGNSSSHLEDLSDSEHWRY